MLSETKSTACSQHISSQLTLSLYLPISLSSCLLSAALHSIIAALSFSVLTACLSLRLSLSASLSLRRVIELLNVSLKLTYCTGMPNIDSDILCSSNLVNATRLFQANASKLKMNKAPELLPRGDITNVLILVSFQTILNCTRQHIVD